VATGRDKQARDRSCGHRWVPGRGRAARCAALALWPFTTQVAMSMFWRVFAANAAILILGTVILVVYPARSTSIGR
jgi:hypothetical protein